MDSSIKVNDTPRGKMWTRLVPLRDADDGFDLDFWQAQTAEARFAAAWEMVETAWEMKSLPLDELRLQRSISRFVPAPG